MCQKFLRLAPQTEPSRFNGCERKGLFQLIFLAESLKLLPALLNSTESCQQRLFKMYSISFSKFSTPTSGGTAAKSKAKKW